MPYSMSQLKTLTIVVFMIYTNFTLPERTMLRNISVGIDSNMRADIKHFVDICDAVGKDCTGKLQDVAGLEVEYGETRQTEQENVIGLCTTITQGFEITGKITFYRRITLLASTKYYTPDQRFLLISHELQHCLLNKDHHPGDKVHLMRAAIPSQSEISKYSGGVDQIVLDSILDTTLPEMYKE